MRVLIAEDDPITLESLGACFATEGFRPVLAADGEAAWNAWLREKIDFVCLDIMMPKLDGYEVCRRIRKQDAETPVLFLSAKNEEIDVVVGLELGADEFIRKPFGKSELLARVRAVLRRTAARRTPADSDRLTIGPITVLPRELRATLADGTSIDLTTRETAMLRLLVEHRGRPVTRDQFLDACWGQDYFPESRTLDQHISQLRKKLDPTQGNPALDLIQTVRGVGYRLEK